MNDLKDTLKKNKALLITLPSSIKWEDYEKQVMNFKVPVLPKDTKGIERVYLIHKGYIVGWQKFVGTSDKPFNCTTTGKSWNGKFLQRTGEFYKINPIPHKGFQGFRYYYYE